ncbi:MAG: UDP-3-O-acyl-N-acetylglucosamine deacetylase [Syntrophobacterales bacterium]|nr:UDP-3-O-acyl-N-acetylglucosamine deacetylase [Syntrophobacterales bacterium]
MGDSIILEHTVGRKVVYEGIGLHTGRNICITIHPAPPLTGIVFKRSRRFIKESVKASYENISQSVLATTIGFNGTGVSTVEHLLAAFMGCGIDNAIVEVNGPEIPIADGSAISYVKLILDAGIVPQRSSRRFLVIHSTVEVREGDAYLVAKPSPDRSLTIDYSIEFDHPLIGFQSISWSFDSKRFVREIAPARTFGFLKDASILRTKGLALGGSLDNVLVFDNHSLLNPEGFRFTDECVRHKVLDLIGDIMLLGKPVIGHFIIHKGGHRLHHKLLRKILTVLEEVYWEDVKDVVCNFAPPSNRDLFETGVSGYSSSLEFPDSNGSLLK